MVGVESLAAAMLIWPAALFAAQAGRLPVRAAGTQPAATRPSAPVPPHCDRGRQEAGVRGHGVDPELDELIDMLIPEPGRRGRRRPGPPRRWDDLSPQDRRKLRARYEHFKALPEEQQKQLRDLWGQFRKMPSERRGRLVKLWQRVHEWLQQLTPEQRAEFFRLSPRERVIYIGSLAKAGKLRAARTGPSRDVPGELIQRIAPKLTFDEWADLISMRGPTQWDLLHQLARTYQVSLPEDVPQPREQGRRPQFARALRLFYDTSPEPLRRRVWNLPPEQQVPELMRHYFPALRRFFHELPEPVKRRLLALRTRRWHESQDRLERMFIEHLRRLARQRHPKSPPDVCPVESSPSRP